MNGWTIVIVWVILATACTGEMPGAAGGQAALPSDPADDGDSANVFVRAIARASPRGAYPRYLLDEASYWTAIGVNGDSAAALIDTDGRVEPRRGTFSIEPFLLTSRGRLLSWNDVETLASLEDGALPIPTVGWVADSLALTVTAFADGRRGEATLHLRYRVTNRTDSAARPTLFLAVRPFQVSPPYQKVGGVTRIEKLRYADGVVWVDHERAIEPLTAPVAFGAAPFTGGDIVEHLREGALPSTAAVSDASGRASGALAYRFELAAGGSGEVHLAVPLSRQGAPVPRTPAAFARRLTRTRAGWSSRLGRVRIGLPREAEHIARTLRSTVGYMLINRSGSALVPGPRAHATSWMREGSLAAVALLRMGEPGPVREFIDWYAEHQDRAADLPCCRRSRPPPRRSPAGGRSEAGDNEADAAVENDSHGRFIHLIAEYWRYTGDDAFLERMWPHVGAAVAHIESLRRQRMRDEFRVGGKRALYGILPPSNDPGRGAMPPAHAYADDFLALKGLKDAVDIAQSLGRSDDARRIGVQRDEFERDLIESIRAAMAGHEIDFIPGTVERGDLDAASTALAITPAGIDARLPGHRLAATFEHYYETFVSRRDGTEAWDAYSMNELRIARAFIRLGWKARAHELLDYFFHHQRPPQWNQWSQRVHRDAAAPRFIGDMPHTGVGAAYVHAALDLFAYEREENGALVIGAGIPEDWVTAAEGVTVRGVHTTLGRLSFSMRGSRHEIDITISGLPRLPDAGIIVRSPFDRPIREATINGNAAELTSNTHEIRLDRVPARLVFRY